MTAPFMCSVPYIQSNLMSLRRRKAGNSIVLCADFNGHQKSRTLILAKSFSLHSQPVLCPSLPPTICLLVLKAFKSSLD